MVADLLWSIFMCFVCANSLESLKKKNSTSLGFFEDVSRRFCFQGVKKKGVGHSSYQPTGETTVRHCPTPQSSESLRSPGQGVNGGCNTGEGIAGLHCRWLIATTSVQWWSLKVGVDFHLCSSFKPSVFSIQKVNTGILKSVFFLL